MFWKTILPWEFLQIDNGFALTSEGEKITVSIVDVTGKSIITKVLAPHQQINWQNDSLAPQMLIINVSCSNLKRHIKLLCIDILGMLMLFLINIYNNLPF